MAYSIVLHHHGDLGSLEADVPSGEYLKEPPRFPYAESNLREKLKTTYEQVDDLKYQRRLDSIRKTPRNVMVIIYK